MTDTNIVGHIARAHADVLRPGEILEIDDNTVICNKILTFSCLLGKDGFTDGAILRVGHGKEGYAATWVEISKDTVFVYHRYAEVMCPLNKPHGLELRDFIRLSIDVTYGKATVTIMTSGGMYRQEGINWAGRNGLVYAETEGLEVMEAKGNWLCNDYDKPIYLFGDSYFNATAPARWTSYLINNGYTNCFLTGYPGMRSERGIIDARISFSRGTPKIAVWCLGMNDQDLNGEPNPSWLEATKEFLELCKAKNITPILTLIPSVPPRNNTPKNDWIRASGCRYMDFEKAVGAHLDPAWYPGMLHEDKVHPDVLGAQALYMQAICDIPELLIKS